MNKYVLIDGNNILHRAQAIFVKNREDDPLLSSKGYPTGLVYGVFSMLGDWIPAISGATSIKFFLDGIPARRRDLDPEYKVKENATRLETEDCPIELLNGLQAKNPVHVVIHLLKLVGIDIYHDPNEEADDLIASFVKSNPNDVHVIVSSDMDFYQLLVNHNVVIYRPGIKGNRFFDAERAEEHLRDKFKVSIPPANVRMFKSLTGDVSDLITGIPRLRKKVAAPLCAHVNVDELYASGLPGFSKKEKEKALELRERIKLNWELIGLVDDIDLEPLCVKSTPDFAVADRILKDDLSIFTIPIYSLQLGKSKVRLSDSVTPDYPWLGNI